jgi:hypothetical protein
VTGLRRLDIAHIARAADRARAGHT